MGSKLLPSFSKTYSFHHLQSKRTAIFFWNEFLGPSERDQESLGGHSRRPNLERHLSANSEGSDRKKGTLQEKSLYCLLLSINFGRQPPFRGSAVSELDGGKGIKWTS